MWIGRERRARVPETPFDLLSAFEDGGRRVYSRSSWTTTARPPPLISARTPRGSSSALRAGLSDTAKLTKPEALRQISQYRATLRKWLRRPCLCRKLRTLLLQALRWARRPSPPAPEELLESNWRARAAEQAYAQHTDRQTLPRSLCLCLNLYRARVDECAAVCRAWFDVCTDDVLWSGFLADICFNLWRRFPVVQVAGSSTSRTIRT